MLQCPTLAATEQSRAKPAAKSGDPKMLRDLVIAWDTIKLGKLFDSGRYTPLSFVDAEQNTPLHLIASRCEESFEARFNMARIFTGIASRYVEEAKLRGARNKSGQTPWQVSQAKCNGPWVVTLVLRDGFVRPPQGRGRILPTPADLAQGAEWLRKADDEARRGAWVDAYQSYSQAADFDVYNPRTYHGMATAALRRGDLVSAAVTAGLALRVDPDNPTYQSLLDEITRDGRAGRQEEAQVLSGRASQLRLAGAYEEAISVYQQAKALDPTSISALNGEGVAQFALGRYALAQSAFEAALRYSPNDPTIQANLANAQAALAGEERRRQEAEVARQQQAQAASAAAARSDSSNSDAQAVTDAIIGIVGAVASNRVAQQQAAQQAAQERAQLQAQQAAQQRAQREAQAASAAQQARIAREQAERARVIQEQQQSDRLAREQQAKAQQLAYQEEQQRLVQERNRQAQLAAQQQAAGRQQPAAGFSPPPASGERPIKLGSDCPGQPAGSRNCGFTSPPNTAAQEKAAREKREFDERMRLKAEEDRLKQAEINRKLQEDARRNMEQATAYRNDINRKNEATRVERERYVNGQASRHDAINAAVVDVGNCPVVRLHNNTDINLSVTYDYSGTVSGQPGPSGSWTVLVPKNSSIDSIVPRYACDGKWKLGPPRIRWQATQDNYYRFSPA